MQNAQLESITSFNPQRPLVTRDRHAAESDPVVVWQLRRSGDDLLCATVLTTIALALSGDLVIFELEPNLGRLTRVHSMPPSASGLTFNPPGRSHFRCIGHSLVVGESLRHRHAVVRCTISPQRSPAASRRASPNRWHAR